MSNTRITVTDMQVISIETVIDKHYGKKDNV
mgnify:FL=1